MRITDWCGIFTAVQVNCSPTLNAAIESEKQAVLTLNWDKSLINTYSCSVAYTNPQLGTQTFSSQFNVQITNPCMDKDLM